MLKVVAFHGVKFVLDALSFNPSNPRQVTRASSMLPTAGADPQNNKMGQSRPPNGDQNVTSRDHCYQYDHHDHHCRRHHHHHHVIIINYYYHYHRRRQRHFHHRDHHRYRHHQHHARHHLGFFPHFFSRNCF